MYTELSSLLLAFYVSQEEYAATPLLIACDKKHIEVAKYLIDKGANINHQNKVADCYCALDSLIKEYAHTELW